MWRWQRLGKGVCLVMELQKWEGGGVLLWEGGSWVGRGGGGSAMVGGDRNDNQEEECDAYNLQEWQGRSHV